MTFMKLMVLSEEQDERQERLKILHKMGLHLQEQGSRVLKGLSNTWLEEHGTRELEANTQPLAYTHMSMQHR